MPTRDNLIFFGIKVAIFFAVIGLMWTIRRYPL